MLSAQIWAKKWSLGCENFSVELEAEMVSNSTNKICNQTRGPLLSLPLYIVWCMVSIAPDDEVEVSPLVDVVPRLARRVDEDVGVLGALRLERLQSRRHEALELLRRSPRLRLEEAHLKKSSPSVT